jgi:hypothetical protein
VELLFLHLPDSVIVCLSLRGPDGVKIENADGAVATVTGLQVGEYEFSLTVTDERKLANTDTVTVIVREGNSPVVCFCLNSLS